MKTCILVCLVLVGLCIPAFAEPNLNLGSVTVSGTMVSFPVTLTNTPGTPISSIDAYIIFDSERFALRNITLGTAAANAGKQISGSVNGGKLHAVIFNIGDNSTISNGEIAQINFDITAAAASPAATFSIVPSATTPDGSSVTMPINVIAAPSSRLLTVTISGNGTGSINSTPAGIACSNSSCSANFYTDSTVTLMPTASASSSFRLWTGDCRGSGSCAVLLSAAHSATATFILNDTVRTSGQSYGSLNSAYATISNDATVQTMATTFIEAVDLNRDVSITLLGGYDATFQNQTGFTAIEGALTISNGSCVIDRLELL